MIKHKDIKKLGEVINDLTDDEGNINCVSLIFKLHDLIHIEDEFVAYKFMQECIGQPQVEKFVWSQPLNLKEGK